MLIERPAAKRDPRCCLLEADLCVVGGGLAGTCCAITAARAGAKVVLIQDRPVLGGNASSEVRLWVLGATSHMHNNNRWAREGGVVDEILVENMYRNSEGNPCIVDTILLEKIDAEKNITLLLNTAMHDCDKAVDNPDRIAMVRAFCSQNQTAYHVKAEMFVDASGDGILGFVSGAAFRMGAESIEEFGEKFAPDEAYGKLLGHSIYFYSKDVGKPVTFVPPSFALPDITNAIPRYRDFNTATHGCRLWWIEYGGRMDTIHDSEAIKWELWRVVYGVWDYIKNSGEFPDASNLTLEWVGTIPGKRESRRFEGDYMLTQGDIINQTQFDDSVSFGGWSIDLHPADGVYATRGGCDQYHSKGVYGIPYRCLYSRNIANLFLAGRVISASHVAFGSTRVMGTCAHSGQAVGLAAVTCVRRNLLPRDLSQGKNLRTLQRDLVRTGQYIPDYRLGDDENLTQHAQVTASSTLSLDRLMADATLVMLDRDRAQMLPVSNGRLPKVTMWVDVLADTTLEIQLRASSKAMNHTPDVILDKCKIALKKGLNQPVVFDFDVSVASACYAFYCLMRNKQVEVHQSTQRLTGILSLQHHRDQKPASDIGVEHFEFWSPTRRPDGKNFAMSLEPAIVLFEPGNVANGIVRPVAGPNVWIAAMDDPDPVLTLTWPSPQTIRKIVLNFDADCDHPMESILWGQPERVMPFCVRTYKVIDGQGGVLHACENNHQAINRIILEEPVTTDRLRIKIEAVHGACPASIFDVRCYG